MGGWAWTRIFNKLRDGALRKWLLFLPSPLLSSASLDQLHQQQRVLKKTNRDLERDRHSMDRQEKQLVRYFTPGICVCVSLNSAPHFSIRLYRVYRLSLL